ncbi:hypothetical protein ACS0TY_023991 [Phlomoides rotata]
MDSHHLNPQSLLDALYCEEEEHWENDTSPQINSNNKPLLDFSEQDLLGDEELKSLLHKEQEIEPHNGFEQNPSLASARGEAVEWMLKVIGYYSFSALTAVLAVNYLDRFLHTFHCDEEKPWMSQLAAVACLSLAAKVEETQVPLLLDLQVEESKFVFESKTIQRMEILVLSTLKWRMNPVTPLSFLDHIVKKLGLKSCNCRDFVRRCESLLLSLVSDCRFMCHLPSAMATATMLYVISSLEPFTGVEYQDQLIAILGIKKEKVEECCRLIEKVATSVDFFYSCYYKRTPGSPKGVGDVCFSSSDDTSNDSSSTASVSSSPHPLSKKIKTK